MLTAEQLRQIDAAVAEEMGLEVVGEAWCWNPDGSGWNLYEWEEHGLSDPDGYGILRPVFLDHCACEYYADDEASCGGAEFETKRFGHYKLCLSMVPHYTTSIEAAWQVIDYVWAHGYKWRVISNGNPIICRLVPLVEPHAFVYADAPTAPLAICLAFLRARGRELQ